MIFFELIVEINELICNGQTGTSVELANKIGKSRSMVFIYFGFMRKAGAPITYCPIRRGYFYPGNEKYKFGFYTERR